MEEKICATCKKTKPVTAFDLKGIGPTGTNYRRKHCRNCWASIRRARYAREPERRKYAQLSAKRWRNNNHEYYRQMKHKQYERTIAQIRLYNQRPEVKARQRTYNRRRQHDPKRRAYSNAQLRTSRKAHPDHFRQQVYRWAMTRRLRKLGYKGESISRSTVIARDNSTCYICERVLKDNQIHLDHVVPLSRGGKHAYANVRVACKSCNLRKHNKLLEELGIVVKPLPP